MGLNTIKNKLKKIDNGFTKIKTGTNQFKDSRSGKIMGSMLRQRLSKTPKQEFIASEEKTPSFLGGRIFNNQTTTVINTEDILTSFTSEKLSNLTSIELRKGEDLLRDKLGVKVRFDKEKLDNFIQRISPKITKQTSDKITKQTSETLQFDSLVGGLKQFKNNLFGKPKGDISKTSRSFFLSDTMNRVINNMGEFGIDIYGRFQAVVKEVLPDIDFKLTGITRSKANLSKILKRLDKTLSSKCLSINEDERKQTIQWVKSFVDTTEFSGFEGDDVNLTKDKVVNQLRQRLKGLTE